MFSRRILAAAAVLAWIAPSFAQAPGPVPALPDSERRTTYNVSGTTCACAVNFAIYGDSTDYGNWISVWVNGVQIPSSSWVLTSPSGSLATLPRPITDAVLTFNAPQTGTVQIVGARRPRRASQFTENRGVAARDINQVVTDMEAQLRELWDRQVRTVQAPPGETLNVLSKAASRASQNACFDSGGNLTNCVSVTGTTITAGNGISFTGTNPTTISANIQAGTGITITGTNPLTIGSTLVSAPIYDTATALAAATVDPTQTVLQTRGKLSAGDLGGARYLQVSSNPNEPGSFALLNGKYVKLLEPIVTPEMFQLSGDTGDDALMFGRFFTYVNTIGAQGICTKNKTYTFITGVTITVPSVWRTKVSCYGAVFTTSIAINQFTVTGGGYSGGMDLEGFTFNHQNNANVVGAFRLVKAGNVRLIKPVIIAGQTTNTGYAGIYIGQSIPGDSSTGSFWNVIQDMQVYSLTADQVPYAVYLEGAANATRIIGGSVNTFTRGVSIFPGASPYYSANSVVIDGVAFESGTYGVYYSGVMGNTNTRVVGLKVLNNRFELLSQAGTAFVNTNQPSEAPPEFRGNFYLGAGAPVYNPNAIALASIDLPQTLVGVASFSAATSAGVSFSVAQPSANYNVSLDVPDSKNYWVSGKSAAGFTINVSTALTGTVGWTITRR